LSRYVLAGFAVLATSLAAPALAFGGTRGDGNKVTQSRAVGPFAAIRNEGALDVQVDVGPAPSVAVTIDQNLQPLVETAVSGDTLVIRVKDASWSGEASVKVTVPALAGYSVKGSGDATIQGAKGGDLSLSVSGSGDVRWSGAAARLDVAIDGSGDVALSGSADALHVAINGSGGVKAKALVARSADVGVNGSGDVELALSGGSLKARVNGSGDVEWRGTASTVDAVAHGSGAIKHGD
jgi:hypothetical protein